MLGEKLDYLILRPFTHREKLATEKSPPLPSELLSPPAIDWAMGKVQEYIGALQGHFPNDVNLRFLDIGCGNGDKTIALAKLGYRNVTGIDAMPYLITRANRYALDLQVQNYTQFICQNIHDWTPPHLYDVLLSFEAFEHISDPQALLRKMATLVTSTGLAVLVFGPLFHSPYGDHMWRFFRTQLPWRGVLFSERAILRLRRECFRPNDPAVRYQDIIGGLNLMRFSEFVHYVDQAGWQFEFLGVNEYLRRHPVLYQLSNLVNKIPLVNDYFAEMVYAVLRQRKQG